MSMPPPPPQYQPYGGYTAQEHPQGTTILVLGILSLVVCSLLGPFAWVMGNNAIAEIDHNPTAYTNRGAVQAGRICGIVSTCIMLASIVFVIVILIVAAAASSGA
jgi:hypothetical protein